MKRDAFILMPSGLRGEYEGGEPEAEYVFSEIIRPAVEEASQLREFTPRIRREIDKRISGSITKGIIQSIVSSDIVIVDITGSNPNVFFELGIRYSLRNRGTILIGQAKTDIPFDISAYRCIQYDKFKPSQAREAICEAITTSLDSPQESDSIVFDVFRDMSVNIPGVSMDVGDKLRSAGSTMPWAEYMKRIKFHCSYLRDPLAVERRFPLDAIIGVTNGGLVAADLISKGIDAKKPVLSLWARRHRRGEGESLYFDNEFNIGTISALKSLNRDSVDVPIGILVMDDHMGTGQTAIQAIKFLENNLGKNVRIIFIPIVCRRRDHLELVEDFLPYKINLADGSKLDTSRDEFWHNINAEHDYLPYHSKQISKSSSKL